MSIPKGISIETIIKGIKYTIEFFKKVKENRQKKKKEGNLFRDKRRRKKENK